MAAIGEHSWLSCLSHRRGHGLGLSSQSSVHHGWTAVDVGQAVDRVVCIAVEAALTTLFVLQVVVI